MKIPHRWTALLLGAIALPLQAYVCPLDGPSNSKLSSNATAAPRFVTSDIALFWKAYDQATPETAARIYDEEYLAKGSAGLKGFQKLRIGTAQQLARAVQATPRYYAGLRADSLKVDQYTDAMRAAFACLAQIYPDAVLPDVYFLIGRMNSAGTLDQRQLYIGVDLFGKDSAPLGELGAWHFSVVGSVARLPYIVAHEAIHFQQRYPAANTLLGHALNEGIADFIAELIAGQHINPHLHTFGDPREAELWALFKTEMGGNKLGNWLYQGDKAPPGKPADLGYYMGYKIAAAYYARASDKRRAVHDMLNITDFTAFLAASGYAAKMEAQSNVAR